MPEVGVFNFNFDLHFNLELNSPNTLNGQHPTFELDTCA